MSSVRVPAYPVVHAELRESVARCMTIGFLGDGDVHPGPRLLPGNRYVFGHGTNWSVTTNALHVRWSIRSAEWMKELFGPQGVLPATAEVGIACEWTSPTMSRRGVVSYQSVRGGALPTELNFELDFSPGEMRGSVRLSLQLFVSKAGAARSDERHLANVAGLRLGAATEEYELIFDGDGSLFPITEADLGVEGPLWKFEENWDDPFYDQFDREFLALVVNSSHPSFSELKGADSTPYQTLLFRQVLAGWLMVFLWRLREQLLAGESDSWDAIVAGDRSDVLPASIVDAAIYFIDRGNLATSSPHDLMETCMVFVDDRYKDEKK